MKNIWTTYEDKINEYIDVDFSIKQINKVSYYFFYDEIYNWNYYKTKCIYEKEFCEIEKNDIVVDLGSNIGLFTRYAAEKSKKVISIEGSPEHFSCLIKNTHDLNNIEYLNANIVGENKYSNTWSHRKSSINITINDIFNLYRIEQIDFLKVDIEGGEYEIFETLTDEDLKKIKKIAIETHDNNMNYKIYEKFINKKFIYNFDWYYSNSMQRMLYLY